LFLPHDALYSAKRGIATPCRPSACLSVTLVDCDHMCWKSWKLIARTISPTCTFALRSPRLSTYSRRNMEKFGTD